MKQEQSHSATNSSGSSSSGSSPEEETVSRPVKVSKYFVRNTRSQTDQKLKAELVRQEEEEADEQKPKIKAKRAAATTSVNKTKSKKAKPSSSADIEDFQETWTDEEKETQKPTLDGHGNVFVYRDKKKYSLKWMPKNFQLAWDNIERMRQAESAPVDTMGCSKCHDEDEPDLSLQRFQSLVALMLSSQTRDEINYAAMDRLKKSGLSVQFILDVDERELADLIKPVSFHNTKAKNLKKVCQILRNQFADDIPGTAEGLCQLPGVGPKMAHLTMKCAWNEITGKCTQHAS